MKKLFALILVAATLLALTACGGEKPAETAPKQTEEKKTAVVVDTEPAAPVFPEGTVSGKTYTAKDGLTFTLPSEGAWAFGKVNEFPTESGIHHDAVATDASTGSNLSASYTITNISPEDFLANRQKKLDSLSGQDLELLEAAKTIKLGDKDFTMAVFQVEAAGLSTVEYHIVRKVEGGMLQILEISIFNCYEAQDIVTLFEISA